jgi:hypothetical protein
MEGEWVMAQGRLMMGEFLTAVSGLVAIGAAIYGVIRLI